MTTAAGRPPAPRLESGMATAELAVALPVVALLLSLCLAAVSWGSEQVRCLDAARSAVRLLARGEPAAAVRQEAIRAGPPGARVSTASSAGWGSVTVTGDVPAPLRWLGLRARPSATATAVLETALARSGPPGNSWPGPTP